MKKTALAALCVLAVAVLWFSCLRSEARELVSLTGWDLSGSPAAASAATAGARTPHNDPMFPMVAASDMSTPAALTQADVTGVRVPFKGSSRFDHLVAETSAEEAMAPQKSDFSDPVTPRTR